LQLSDGLSPAADSAGSDEAPRGFSMLLTLMSGACVTLRYVIPIHHACAHACRWALGVEATPGAAHCGEAAEHANSMARVGPRGGSLANAGREWYLSGWTANYAEHNARQNERAAEVLLRSIGRTYRSLHAASAAYALAAAAEVARRQALALGLKRRHPQAAADPASFGTPQLERLLTLCARDLAVAGRDGLEGGSGRSGSAAHSWVRTSTDLSVMSNLLDAVAPLIAAATARASTRNVASHDDAVKANVTAAVTMALAEHEGADKILRAHRGFSARSREAAAHRLLTDLDFIKTIIIPALLREGSCSRSERRRRKLEQTGLLSARSHSSLPIYLLLLFYTFSSHTLF